MQLVSSAMRLYRFEINYVVLCAGLIGYFGGGYNYDSTAIRPRYDHSTTFVTTVGIAALVSKQVSVTASSVSACLALVCYVIVTLMTLVERPSKRNGIVCCNHRISGACRCTWHIGSVKLLFCFLAIVTCMIRCDAEGNDTVSSCSFNDRILTTATTAVGRNLLLIYCVLLDVHLILPSKSHACVHESLRVRTRQFVFT